MPKAVWVGLLEECLLIILPEQAERGGHYFKNVSGINADL